VTDDPKWDWSHPTVTGSAYPFNFSLDDGPNLSLNAALGFAYSRDLTTGQQVLALQGGIGMTIKLDVKKDGN
jgi:hypothetical protein